MTRDEEYAAVVAAQGGDEHSLNAVIAHNMPLVYGAIREYRWCGESVEDLEQAGCMGLIKAVRKYRGRHRLATIAYKAIRWEMFCLARSQRRFKKAVSQAREESEVGHELEVEDEVGFVMSVARLKCTQLELELIKLRAMHGMAWEDIGERLGTQCAKSAYNRALKRLRFYLGVRRDIDEGEGEVSEAVRIAGDLAGVYQGA